MMVFQRFFKVERRLQTARTHYAIAGVLTLLCVPMSAGAGEGYDPFDTATQHPRAANEYWEGQARTLPCPGKDFVPDPLPLLAAVDLALCNNPRTRESWATAKASAAFTGVARSAYFPELDAVGTVERNRSRTEGVTTTTDDVTGLVTFDYLLFDFGGRAAALDEARQSLLAADWSHNATLQAIVLDAVRAFYLYFATQENVLAAQAAEQASLQSLQAAQARKSAGTSTRADVLQAQTAYAQARLTRTDAEGQAANARGTLASTLGLPADRPLTIVPPADLDASRLGAQALERLMETARTTRPDLLAAKSRVRAAESEVGVQESAHWPSVDLFASTRQNQLNRGVDPDAGEIGISLNLPLFTGFRTTYRVAEARGRLEEQVARRDRLENEISLDVWGSYQDLRTQEQALATTTELVASASESYEVALGRYKAGVGTVIDLLNAQSALADANAQRIAARYRWNAAKANLARAIGILEPSKLAGSETTGSDRKP
jgi:TolC family type I secretion outer membrane protein